MTWTAYPANVAAAHEAAHCAALCMSDPPWPPLSVAIHYPHQDQKGNTKPDWSTRDPTDPRALKELLVATLAGVATEAAIDFTAWPVTAEQWGEQFESDAQVVAFICEFIGLDQISYIAYVCKAQELVRNTRFRQLMSAISAELRDRELLLQPEIVSIASRID